MNSLGKILFLSVSLVGLDAAMLVAMSSGGSYASVLVQPSSDRPAVPSASQASASLHALSRFIPRRPLCAGCSKAPSMNKRQECNHSFCNSCYESSRVGECPTCTEEANQCAICLNLFDDSVKMLLCGHMFCADCIAGWRAQCIVNIREQQAGEEYEETCPACRDPLVFKEEVSCEICGKLFKKSDEVTPPLVCKLIEWCGWRDRFICKRQFAHRFHDICFNKHYMQQDQHMTDSREHKATCPIHKMKEPCPEHPDGCSLYAHKIGYIKLPHILPDRGGPQQYVEYEPVEPNNDPPSPRTAEAANDVVDLDEYNAELSGPLAPLPDWLCRLFGLGDE